LFIHGRWGLSLNPSTTVFTRRLLVRTRKGHGDLVDQLRRSAQSIPQNVAEGAGKTTRADKAKHYTIASGSAMESAAHLDVMKVEELIDDEQYAVGAALLERVVAMLTKMIDPCSSMGADHAHGVVPVHVHRLGHGHGHGSGTDPN
jgi:four helix bundle protein